MNPRWWYIGAIVLFLLGAIPQNMVSLPFLMLGLAVLSVGLMLDR